MAGTVAAIASPSATQPVICFLRLMSPLLPWWFLPCPHARRQRPACRSCARQMECQRRDTKQGAGRGSRLMGTDSDCPGVAGVEELAELALALLAPRRFDLLRHQGVVDRAFDVSEDPKRSRAMRGMRQA